MRQHPFRWMATLTAGGVLLFVGSAAAVLGDFAPPATSPEVAGDRPIGIAAGNLNGDSNTDLAVANFDDDTVTVLLGDGTGNFTEKAMTSPETVGEGPSSVAIANLDGDGDQDLAVANDTGLGPSMGVVSVLRNDGSGDFTATAGEIANNAPAGIAAANLNGDAQPDLAVTNNLSHDVSIFINDGLGAANFNGPTNIPTGTANPRNIVAANIDGDADTDLAIPNNNNGNAGTVAVLLGDGVGGFTDAGPNEAVGNGPDAAAGADLNGDSKLDLAVGNGSDDNVTILLGDGMGDFSEKPMTSPETVGNLPQGVVAANLNGDAFPDLAVANYSDDNVSILLNSGTGDFTAPGTSPEGAGDQARALVAANLNGDSAFDLAVANDTATPPGSVSILLNQLPPVVPIPPTTATTPASPAATTPKKRKCKKRKTRAAAAKRKCKRKKR